MDFAQQKLKNSANDENELMNEILSNDENLMKVSHFFLI